jgi:ATP-binding cassette, subfamily F, member 3
MIIFDDASLSLGGKPVVAGLSANLSCDQRVGLVGRNGSGKSTLLKVINGSIKLDSGTLTIEKSKKVAYMPQDINLDSDKTVLAEAMTAFEDKLKLKVELDKILDELETNHDMDDIDEKLERVGYLSEKLSDTNFDELEKESRDLLNGLGFSDLQIEQQASTLSQGWKMRLVLAQLLLLKADFYLFDEPTNHLDIMATDWLVNFIKHSNFGFLLVCHDRYFLDHLCENILDMDQHPNRLYRGNYTKFLSVKEGEVEALMAAATNQEKMLKAKIETINRFKAKASKAKMAQSMMKEVDKIVRIKVPATQKRINISFPAVEKPGRVVLTVDNFSKSFGEKNIFKNVSFQIFRNEKVAIVASNGKGKTTLLSCISGLLTPDTGTVEEGLRVETSVFEQDQDKVLNPKSSILEEVDGACTTFEQGGRVRALLGAFLFPGKDVHKKIGVLSGGEKNRVAMVKTLIQNKNLLLLDEPTNHLDLDSKEILLGALKKFDGTILFVSHDRTFLDNLATRVLELTPNGISSYDGNYESYLYQKHNRQGHDQIAPAPQIVESKIPKKSSENKNNQSKEKKRKVGQLEIEIEKLEKKLLKFSTDLGTHEYGTEEHALALKNLKETESKLKMTNDSWEKLMDSASK